MDTSGANSKRYKMINVKQLSDSQLISMHDMYQNEVVRAHMAINDYDGFRKYREVADVMADIEAELERRADEYKNML